MKDIKHAQNEINKFQHGNEPLFAGSVIKQYQNQINLDKRDIESKQQLIDRLEKDLRK